MVQISVKSVKPFGYKKILMIAIFYILLLTLPYLMVTITNHIVRNLFQTVHFSAVRFNRGVKKYVCFLLIPKSQKV